MFALLIRTVPPSAILPRSAPARCSSASSVSLTMSEEIGVALVALIVTLSGMLAPPRSTVPWPEICPWPAVAVSSCRVTMRPVAPTRALIWVRLSPEEIFSTLPLARVALPWACGAAGVPVTAISTVTTPRTTLPRVARKGSSRRRSVRPFSRRLMAPVWFSGTSPLAARATRGPAVICASIVALWLVKLALALMSAGGNAAASPLCSLRARAVSVSFPVGALRGPVIVAVAESRPVALMPGTKKRAVSAGRFCTFSVAASCGVSLPSSPMRPPFSPSVRCRTMMPGRVAMAAGPSSCVLMSPPGGAEGGHIGGTVIEVENAGQVQAGRRGYQSGDLRLSLHRQRLRGAERMDGGVHRAQLRRHQQVPGGEVELENLPLQVREIAVHAAVQFDR